MAPPPPVPHYSTRKQTAENAMNCAGKPSTGAAQRNLFEGDSEMNECSDNSGRQAAPSIGNNARSRTPRSTLNRAIRRNRLALAVSLALLAMAPGLALAGPGKVCLDGTTVAPGAVLACADGAKPVGTYYANSPSLRKFVDTMPGLTAGHANTFAGTGKPGEYIPIAVADTTSYVGSEYFIIGVVEHTQWMHSDLQKQTTQRGYVQLYPKLSDRPAGSANPPVKAVDSLTGQVLGAPVALSYPNGTPITWPGTKTAASPAGEQVYGYDSPRYLGPIILTMSGTPVRVKMVNFLPTERATLDASGQVTARNGDMFLPVDESLAGAGLTPAGDKYPQNRVAFHLHGGDSPWTSDGTPHQWITATGDSSPYKSGDRFMNTPDMPYPGDGAQTIFWPNDQSARLMWYHDHTFGLTRQNAYAGAAAGYVIIDAAELALLNGGTVNGVAIHKALPGGLLDQLVLVVQDKSWVPNDIAIQDSKWDVKAWGKPGDLWFPHVYEPNQLWGASSRTTSITEPTALNPAGRWDYAVDDATGTYLSPKVPVHADADFGDVTFPDGSYGNVSATPESYMDTPVVNGVAYPVLKVDPKAYRVRFLNGANDRYWNLSLWIADGVTKSADGRSNTEVAMVAADGASYTLPDGSKVTVNNDLRPGGVPDPRTAGPSVIQFANEAGFLPAPAVHAPTPMNIDPASLLETGGGFYLGGAERADTVIDFSQYAGKTLIMYNDSTAPVPGGDPRYDYFTGNPDQTPFGGAPTTLAGFGPNTRTVMQIVVSNAPMTPDYPTVAGGAYDIAALKTNLAAAYTATADPHIMAPGVLPGIDTSANTITLPGATQPIALRVKTIQGFTDPNFGRLIAQLGTELPNATNANEATALAYVDAPTDIISAGETQYWLIKNNDMDNHPMHFHLFNVQVLARVDQFTKVVKGPEPDETGWKETVKNWPGEDVVVAMKPKTPQLPFGLPNSVRLLDPTLAPGASANSALSYLNATPVAFSQIDLDPFMRNGDGSFKIDAAGKTIDNTNFGLATSVSNTVTDFGWEYVWHCHILGHEENDLMRPMLFLPVITAAAAPSGVAVSATGVVSWTDPTPAHDATGGPNASTKGNAGNEIGFRVERAAILGGVASKTYTPVATPGLFVIPSVNTLSNATSLQDAPTPYTDFNYRVVSVNQGFETPSAAVKLSQPPAPPVGLSASALLATTKWSVTLGWTDAATNETGYVVQRATGSINASTGVVTWGAFASKPAATSLLAANLSAFADGPGGVAGNTLYQYQVHAVNGASAGPQTSVVVATATTLAEPTQMQSGGVSTKSSVALQWQPAAAALATGYEIQHCAGTALQCTTGPLAIWMPTSGQIRAGVANTRKVVDIGLASKTTYQFRVRTINAVVPNLVSAWTAMFQARTL
jgi:FtsP/CotA-like multicopper oxidase with cupredoxin domain